ncbi:MAG: hypothetical protein IJD92_02410 [Bacilli bacterium]|nr:hypothetical protein [Bacilli bacterium]
MKKVMIDMDNVLTDTDFFEIIEEYVGEKIDFDNVGFYLQDVLGDKKEDFFNKFKYMNLYKKSTLLPDCYEVLKKLNEHYEIYICTDYVWKEIKEFAGDNLKNKYEFLYRELDFINPKNFIFACNKSLINCDIKIDDKIENILDAKTKILFTAYHNKKISDKELKDKEIIRVNNWNELGNLLLEEYVNNRKKILLKKI